MKILSKPSKIEVLLVHPLPDYTIPGRYTTTPLGLCCLAGYLENKGISTEILDMQIYSHPYKLLVQILSQRRPRIVGVPSYSPNLHIAYEIVRRIKQLDSKIITVVGGPQASALPEETMYNCKDIDYLIYGEGEVTLYELAYNLIHDKDVKEIKGTAMRIDNRLRINPPRKLIQDIDSLPFPAREKLDLKRYRPGPVQCLRFPTTAMFTTRGCPFKCTFCSSHLIWGDSVRMMSTERVFQEVVHCMEKHGIRDFYFVDDTFTLSRSRIVQLCNLFINNRLDISWSCFSRVDTVDYELLCLMKEAGCFRIQYGVEAGTESSLKTICKGTSLQQAEDAILWTKKAGIEILTDFMLGLPGETIEDMKKTIAFAKKLNPDWALFRRCYPLPGSKMFDGLKDNARPLSTYGWANLLRRAYISFYFSLPWIWQEIRKIFKSPRREIEILWNAIPIFLKRVKVIFSEMTD
ncbi:MAG: radical SAM protein [Nitrospirota bacterium]